MSEQDNQLSFLPDDYIERRIEQRTNFICLTLFVIVLGGVITAYVITQRQRGEIRERRAQVNEAYTEAARRLEQLDRLQAQKEQMMRKAQVTAALVEPVPRTFLLADLINRMPESLSLFDFELSTKEIRRPSPRKRNRSALANNSEKDGKDGKDGPPAPPPVPERKVTLVMVGVAPTDVQVAKYMSTLSRSPLLSDVNLVFSEETKIQESTMRKFRIEITLDRDADARQVKPLKRPRRPKTNPMKQPSLTEQVPKPDSGEKPESAEKPGADGMEPALRQINDQLPGSED